MTRRSGSGGTSSVAIVEDSRRWARGGGARSRVAVSAPPQAWEAALDWTHPFRPGPDGLVLTCRTGTFLVTQEGDPEDHVLEAGGSFRTRNPGLVVAWALRAGVLVALGAAGQRPPPAVGRAVAWGRRA